MSKRRRPTAAESEQNVRDFLDSLEDERFLGNEFIGDDEDLDDVTSDQEEDPSHDVDDDDDNRNPDAPLDADSGDTAPRPNKFSFKNIDAVLDPDNYDAVPEQEAKTYKYTDSTKKFVMNWSTEKKEPPGRCPVRNVLKKNLDLLALRGVCLQHLQRGVCFLPGKYWRKCWNIQTTAYLTSGGNLHLGWKEKAGANILTTR